MEEKPIAAMYLAEKAGRFWPQDPRRKYEVSREFREDPATIAPEERERRAKLLTHQRAQSGFRRSG